MPNNKKAKQRARDVARAKQHQAYKLASAPASAAPPLLAAPTVTATIVAMNAPPTGVDATIPAADSAAKGFKAKSARLVRCIVATVAAAAASLFGACRRFFRW